MLEVLAHGARRGNEDLRDLSIRLALGHPFEYLLLARSEPCNLRSFDGLLANEQPVPAAALSRVSSIDWMLSLGLYPIGLALAGWVAEVIGVGATLAVAAAWALLSTPLVLAVPSMRNLRRRDGPPEVDPATIQPL